MAGEKRGLSSVVTISILIIAAIGLTTYVAYSVLHTTNVLQPINARDYISTFTMVSGTFKLNDSAKTLRVNITTNDDSGTIIGAIVSLEDVEGARVSYEINFTKVMTAYAVEPIFVNYSSSHLKRISAVYIYPVFVQPKAGKQTEDVGKSPLVINLDSGGNPTGSGNGDGGNGNGNGQTNETSVNYTLYPLGCNFNINSSCFDNYPALSSKTPQCMDGIDNDGDGKIDYPNDTNCMSPTDTSELPQPTMIQDENYLLPVNVTIFKNADGTQDFNVTYNGQALRVNVSCPMNSCFYVSNASLNVSYRIVERKGGVDVVYQISNPTNMTIRHPSLTVGGFKNAMNGLVKLNKVQINMSNSSTYISGGYPIDATYTGRGTAYPTLLVEDSNYSVGVSVLYPYLKYGYDLTYTIDMTRVKRVGNEVAAADPNGSWTELGNFFDTREIYVEGQNWFASKAFVPPGVNLTYVFAVRFSTPRNGVFTLYPYKKYLWDLYGNMGSVTDRNRIPLAAGPLPLNGQQLNDSPRGFNTIDPWKRPDLYGWNKTVGELIDRMKTFGITRSMFWAVAGAYLNPNRNNYPMQMMSQWTQPMVDSASEWLRFGSNNLSLGFYWGRAAQVPDPIDQWNPPNAPVADISNETHHLFLLNEIRLAVERGANEVGLDAFVMYPKYRYILYQEYKNITNNSIKFVSEPGNIDFTRDSSMGDYVDLQGKTNIPVPNPDVIKLYLNPGSEDWLRMDYNYSSQDQLVAAMKSGYTPMLHNWNYGNIINVANLTNAGVPLHTCMDGIDNNHDGLIDMHDPKCNNPWDDSE